MGSSIGGKIARGVAGVFTLGLSEAALAGIKAIRGKATPQLPRPGLPDLSAGLSDSESPGKAREKALSGIKKRQTILTTSQGLTPADKSRTGAKRTLLGG